MRILTQEYVEQQKKINPLYFYIKNRPKPDLTEARRLAERFLEETKLVYEKEARMSETK